LYSKLNHIELGLPKNIHKDFEEIWKKNTWYGVLGFNKYFTVDEFRNFANTKYPHIKVFDKKNYNIIQSKFPNNIPKYPLEYYRLDLIFSYGDLLKPSNKN
jgi:hypothetical protein